MLPHQLLRPIRVRRDARVRADIAAAQDGVLQRLKLGLKPRRQHRKPHDLDKPDILLLDMVQLRMRVEHAEGVLLRRAVIAQDEVKLIAHAVAPRDGRDRIMRHAVRLRDDAHGLVVIIAPDAGDAFGQIDDAVRVRTIEPQHRHRPLDDAHLDVREAVEEGHALDARLRHREHVQPALKMLVAQYRAADDGQVCVRADEVVRQHGDEREQLIEGLAPDVHRGVPLVEEDAVLLIIAVRRELHVPEFAVEQDGHHAQILPRGVIQPPGVALVLGAELAFRVAVLAGAARGRDGAGILLRLREVDGDVHRPVLRLVDPVDVAREAVTADVVDVAAEVIEPVRAAFGADRVLAHEAVVHLVREGGQLAHEAGVEQVAFGDAVADEAAADGVVGERGEDGGERLALRSRAAAPLEVHHVE